MRCRALRLYSGADGVGADAAQEHVKLHVEVGDARIVLTRICTEQKADHLYLGTRGYSNITGCGLPAAPLQAHTTDVCACQQLLPWLRHAVLRAPHEVPCHDHSLIGRQRPPRERLLEQYRTVVYCVVASLEGRSEVHVECSSLSVAGQRPVAQLAVFALQV